MSDGARIVLELAAVLCSLVAGFLFAFAVVVMPGIRRLADRDFLRAFREMDGIIQRGHPLFGLVWLGSALALVIGLALGLPGVAALEAVLLAVAGAIYLLGVQLPTFLVNVPLNNELQALDVDGADEATCRETRARFEPRWNGWNRLRTALAVVSSALLLTLLSRM